MDGIISMFHRTPILKNEILIKFTYCNAQRRNTNETTSNRLINWTSDWLVRINNYSISTFGNGLVTKAIILIQIVKFFKLSKAENTTFIKTINLIK